GGEVERSLRQVPGREKPLAACSGTAQLLSERKSDWPPGLGVGSEAGPGREAAAPGAQAPHSPAARGESRPGTPRRGREARPGHSEPEGALASHGAHGDLGLLPVGNPGSRRDNPININHYATKKSVAESMLDVALFMANVTQLKAVLEQEVSFQYYATLISLISISLFFQVVIGILLIIIARLNLNDVSKQHRLNVLNNVATALIFITVILNIFITGFGVQKTGL
uniref:Ninjurin 2 n=1 Tax=Chrysemys picta bellii TaxID=8478 RepID=A0A8C3IVT0_CHRPI